MRENRTSRSLAAAGLAVSPAATPAPSAAAPLQVRVFNPGKEATFPVTSAIISGPHEAMLVDAQFQKQYADRLVRMIMATGKRLKYIYISHGDPDYYFGLAEIKKAFPNARVISTAQTAYLISATKDAKLEVSKPKLGADASVDLFVPEAVTSDELTLDGEKIMIRSTPDESPAQLDFVRDYLLAYQRAVADSKTSEGIVAAMTAKFPDLPGRETLEFGAKVVAGEVPWHAASPYPPIGRIATADFGDVKFRLHFVDNRTMSFEDASGAFQGVTDTVPYTAVEVSRKVFMVYWHEPSTGSNVVHVQDWNTGTVYTNIAAKDGSFTHFKGTIRIQ